MNLASYPSRHCHLELSDSVTVWEASRASLASAFDTEPVVIESTGQSYCDSTLVSNNPIRRLWAEANATWPATSFKSQLGCVVSIGTGAPSVLKFNTSLPDIVRTLREISTETEATANAFIRENTELNDEGRYFRFSVPNGLADIRPDEVGEVGTIVDATQEYLTQELVFKQIRRCAKTLSASGKRNVSVHACVPSAVSAWELPGARRSLDNGKCWHQRLYAFICDILIIKGNKTSYRPGLNQRDAPSGCERKQTDRVIHQSQPRGGRFLGLFRNKKTPVAV